MGGGFVSGRIPDTRFRQPKDRNPALPGLGQGGMMAMVQKMFSDPKILSYLSSSFADASRRTDAYVLKYLSKNITCF